MDTLAHSYSELVFINISGKQIDNKNLKSIKAAYHKILQFHFHDFMLSNSVLSTRNLFLSYNMKIGHKEWCHDVTGVQSPSFQ